MTENSYNWSRKSLDELEQFYYTEIRPAMIQDGYEPPNGRPSYEWLSNNGYSGLSYTLREHHDITLKEFFVEVVGLGPDDQTDDSYDWKLQNEGVIEAIEEYIRGYQMGEPIADSTARTRRSRIARYARTYERLHDGADLRANLDDDTYEPAEKRRCSVVFDALGDELSTSQSKLKYLTDVQQFYNDLLEYTHAEYNPTTNLGKRLGWSHEKTDNKTVDRDAMAAIYAEADEIPQKLQVLGLGAWGLRPVEVASAHVSQFVLDTENPYIDFENRKNGPGEVSLLFGLDVLQQRIEELDNPGWNGYLFPSSTAKTGHITRRTVTNRFKRLAENAGVSVDGETPTGKMGRRFWYTIYKDAVEGFRDQLQGIASDQGSSSVDVVMRNYLSEEEKRKYRREAMRKELANVFGDENSLN